MQSRHLKRSFELFLACMIRNVRSLFRTVWLWAVHLTVNLNIHRMFTHRHTLISSLFAVCKNVNHLKPNLRRNRHRPKFKFPFFCGVRHLPLGKLKPADCCQPSIHSSMRCRQLDLFRSFIFQTITFFCLCSHLNVHELQVFQKSSQFMANNYTNHANSFHCC